MQYCVCVSFFFKAGVPIPVHDCFPYRRGLREGGRETMKDMREVHKVMKVLSEGGEGQTYFPNSLWVLMLVGTPFTMIKKPLL